MMRSTKRLSVWFVPQWYPHEGSIGVSGVFNRELVKAVSPFVDVRVLYLLTDATRRLPYVRWEHFIDEGVPTDICRIGISPVPKTSRLTWMWMLYRMIKKSLKEYGAPDVWHAQDDTSWVVGHVAMRMGRPFVVSQHWTKILKGALPWHEKALYRLVFRRAAGILTPDREAEDRYRAYGLEGKIYWLPNAYDAKIFYPGEEYREKILVHVSGFSPQKRVSDILRAFAMVRRRVGDARLIFIGDGEERAEYERLAAALLPEQSFVFTGFLSKPEIARWLRRARGFVYPSRFETFGCALMEALACGTPAVTTPISGIRTVVSDDRDALFVPVGDIEALAEAMERLLEGRHSIDTRKVAEKMRSSYSYEAVGRRLYELYKQVV